MGYVMCFIVGVLVVFMGALIKETMGYNDRDARRLVLLLVLEDLQRTEDRYYGSLEIYESAFGGMLKGWLDIYGVRFTLRELNDDGLVTWRGGRQRKINGQEVQSAEHTLSEKGRKHLATLRETSCKKMQEREVLLT